MANSKAKKAGKSKPIGSKNLKIQKVKGGTGMTAASKIRGGYGAARPNFGQAAKRGPIKAVGGR